ncbi:MAG: type II secretion system protein [bacterium]|nr:type II secretion system protein [bacterium]
MKGFTLAEVLITLAIIGVVAAISIPSVISNSQQMEFKTGLRKAVSVLNSAITMNMALDGESPYENGDLFNYLQRHMAVMESFSQLNKKFLVSCSAGTTTCTKNNSGFYTTDGMRFEFFRNQGTLFPLYESNEVSACMGSTDLSNPHPGGTFCGGCGSYGLNNNSDNTTKPPCLITVDVNGDRKPNPKNVNCKSYGCSDENIFKFSDPDGKKLTDIFSIMITDKEAIPYGIAAQKAMYNNQK